MRNMSVFGGSNCCRSQSEAQPLTLPLGLDYRRGEEREPMTKSKKEREAEARKAHDKKHIIVLAAAVATILLIVFNMA